MDSEIALIINGAVVCFCFSLFLKINLKPFKNKTFLERERDRQTDREADRQTGRQTERDINFIPRNLKKKKPTKK